MELQPQRMQISDSQNTQQQGRLRGKRKRIAQQRNAQINNNLIGTKLLEQIKIGDIDNLDSEIINYLKSNNNFMIQAIIANSKMIEYFPEVLTDDSIMKYIIAEKPEILHEITELNDNYQLIANAININPNVFIYAPESYQNDNKNVLQLALSAFESGIKIDKILEILDDKQKIVFKNKYNELYIDALLYHIKSEAVGAKFNFSLLDSDEILLTLSEKLSEWDKTTLRRCLKFGKYDDILERFQNIDNINQPPIPPNQDEEDLSKDDEVIQNELETQTQPRVGVNPPNQPPIPPNKRNVSSKFYNIDEFYNINNEGQLIPQTQTEPSKIPPTVPPKNRNKKIERDEIKEETNLDKLDFAMDTTYNKYGFEQIKKALIEHNSLRITQDKGAREKFEDLSKDDIDKEMIKYVYKLVENQKEMFSSDYQFSEREQIFKPLYDLGRSVYFAVNSDENLDFILSDEKNYQSLANLFVFRYKDSRLRQPIDSCIDENDPRLAQIENYFNSKQEIVNSPRTR